MGGGRGALKGNCVSRGSFGAGLSQVPEGNQPGSQVHSLLVSPFQRPGKSPETGLNP